MTQEQREVRELQMELRRIRGCYVQNAREGKFPLDVALLADFDAQLEKLNVHAKSVPAKR